MFHVNLRLTKEGSITEFKNIKKILMCLTFLIIKILKPNLLEKIWI